jgi:hypothetical protein
MWAAAEDILDSGSALPTAPVPSVPLYRTAAPAAITMHYSLQRGPFSGVGELVWAPQGNRYSLSLTGRVAGLRLLQQTSIGQLGVQGLVPEQFSDQRARGAALVATLAVERRVITFSSGATETPWLPGTQDRLSWMVQLPSILNDLPKPPAPGLGIELYVTGARGDTDTWTFRFLGLESVATAAGTFSAAKWVREPRRPNDASIEVWLDPTQNHLPIRAKLGAYDGDSLELLMQP